MAEFDQDDGLVPQIELPNNPADIPKKDQPITQYVGSSLVKFLLLDLISVGFYRFYLIYENWDAIKRGEKRNIWPLWRTIFFLFFVYSFYKKRFIILQKVKVIRDYFHTKSWL